MLRLQSVAEGIARAGSIAGGALLLIASILICIDITLRYTLSVTLGGADELSRYALAIGSAWQHDAAAGLAEVALAHDDVAKALAALADVLGLSAAGGTLAGTVKPRLIELTCYKALVRGRPRSWMGRCSSMCSPS